jgi:hypothetical protein
VQGLQHAPGLLSVVLADYESAQLVKKAMRPEPTATGGRRNAAVAAATGGSKGAGRRTSSRGRGRTGSSRATRGSSRRRSSSKASAVTADSLAECDDEHAAKEQGPGLFVFKGRKTRAALAAAAAGGSSDGSSSSESE